MYAPIPLACRGAMAQNGGRPVPATVPERCRLGDTREAPIGLAGVACRRDYGAFGSATVGTSTPPTSGRQHGGVANARSDDAWMPIAARFVDGHYGTLRGLVRTYVIDQQLAGHLPAPPVQIVDVGGGAGHQSLPLARRGYDVTIVDPSPAMLDRALEILAAEGKSVTGRVQLVQASGEDAPRVLGDHHYGAVLCHGVVMYLDDPTPLVDALCALVAPGGIVSIVAKNVEVLACRPALAGNWAEALAAFDADRQVNGLGMDTRGDSVAGLSDMLAVRRVEPVAWYGVRLFTDGWAPKRPSDDPEDLVLAVELEASRRDPFRQLSRLFHLVGVRRAAG